MTDTNNTLQLDGLTPDWITALRRFFITIALGNIVWEFAHMPLYTIWTEGTPNEIIFAGIHCTGGDILIAGSSLMIAVLLFGRADWPNYRYKLVQAITMALGIGYTFFSEWLNIEVREAWAYSEWMPVLPGTQTGLSPILQWIVIPLLAFWWMGHTETKKRNTVVVSG